MITIDMAHNNDWPEIVALLQESGLKEDGLAEHLGTALVARNNGRLVGVAALEVYGTAALLRSLAVAAGMRGQGLGQRLTQATLDLARQKGVDSVYLLTETAERFFPRFGFQRVSRADVPPSVQSSIEFNGMCPVSCAVMMASMADILHAAKDVSQ